MIFYLCRYPSGSSGSSGGNGSSGGGRSESSARNDDSSYGGGGRSGGGAVDCRVVEGKLFYEKRWYRRGQSIIVEPRQGDKYPAMISAIGESHTEKPEYQNLLWSTRYINSNSILFDCHCENIYGIFSY